MCIDQYNDFQCGHLELGGIEACRDANRRVRNKNKTPRMKGEPRPPDIKCPDELLCLNYWGKGHRISSLLRPSRNDKHGNKVSTVTGICKQCKIEAKAEYARLKKHGDVDPEHMKLLRMYGPKIAAQKMEQKQRTVEKSRSPTQKEKETQWEQDLANYRDVKDHVSTSQAARAKDAKFGMGPRSGPNQVDFKNGGMASHIMDEAMPGHKEKRLENERRVKEYQEVQAKKQEAKAEKEAAEKAAALVKKNREMIARGLKEERLKEERMVKKRKAEEEDSQDAPKKKAKAVAKNGEVQAVPPQKQQVPRVYDGTARKPQMKARSTSHRSQHAASSGATQYSRSQVAAPGAVSNFPRIDKQSSPSADECESRGGGKFKPGYDPRRLVLKAPSTKKKAEIPKKPKSSPEPEPIQRQKKRAISDVLDEENIPASPPRPVKKLKQGVEPRAPSPGPRPYNPYELKTASKKAHAKEAEEPLERSWYVLSKGEQNEKRRVAMEAMKAKRVENEAKKEAYKAKKEAQKAAEEKKAADDAARIAANEKAIAAAAAARQAVLEAGIQKARTVQKKLNEQFLAQEQAKRDAKTPSPPAHSPYILEDADLEDSDLEEGEIREEVAQMTPNPITWVPMAADPTDPDARAKDEAEILHSAGDHVFTNPFFKGEKTRKSY